MGCTASPIPEGDLAKLQNNRRVSLTKETSVGLNKNLRLSYAATTMKGWRYFNQDAYLIETVFERTFHENKIALFGVFDGHGGPNISNFAKKYLSTLLVKNPHFQQGQFDVALRDVVIGLDFDMLTLDGVKRMERIQQELLGTRGGSGKDSLFSSEGSTVVLALITQTHIYIANAGDSKAVIYSSNGDIIFQTVDHRPSNAKQRERILSLGGNIQEGRIDGDLNVSRGLGDFPHKNMQEPTKSIVSAIPDVNTFAISPQISYLFLGSDGIWEKPTLQTCRDILQFKDEAGNSGNGIENHLDSLISKTSKGPFGMDNMTSILIDMNLSETF